MNAALRISCGMLIVLAGGVLPRPGAAATASIGPVEVEYRQLERDIPSLYLINGLFLSADQAKSLAALQAEAKQITDKRRIEVDQFFINHQKELNQWLEASLQADGDTSVGEKILTRLREAPADQEEQGREKTLELLFPYVMQNSHETLTAEEMQTLKAGLGKDLDRMIRRIQKMNDADFQMDLLLSADQVAYLVGQNTSKKVKSVWVVSIKRNAANIRQVRRSATKVFDAMDKSTTADWAKIKHETCRNFVESCIRDRFIERQDVDMAAQTTRAEQILDKARTMVQTDYLRAREDLIAEICPRRNKPRTVVYGWKMSHGDQRESLSSTTYLMFSPAMETVLERVAGRKPGV